MKAEGRSVAVLRFDTADTRVLRQSQLDHLAYHFERLLRGEETPASEWEHLGISVEIEQRRD